jgi:hypothetical protein
MGTPCIHDPYAAALNNLHQVYQLSMPHASFRHSSIERDEIFQLKTAFFVICKTGINTI